MAQDLSGTNERLRLALDSFRSWDANISTRPRVHRPLTGKSNQNYLVNAGEDLFVVRVNRDSISLGVRRDLEHRILGEIADQPFAPTVVYATDDFLVTKFVAGRHPRTVTPAVLETVGELFARIHAVPTTARSILNPRDHLGHYAAQVADLDPLLTRCINAALDTTQEPRASCLCHNDLLFENLIMTDDGVVAIDWEYARAGDPAFDIAVFAESHELGPDDTECLLEHYGDDGNIASRLDDMRLLFGLIEVLWWRIRDPGSRTMQVKTNALASRLAVSL